MPIISLVDTITPPRRPLLPWLTHWLVLLLISLTRFGNYNLYDSISPLAGVLKAQPGFSNVNIGLLNAIYSLLNSGMTLIGGIKSQLHG